MSTLPKSKYRFETMPDGRRMVFANGKKKMWVSGYEKNCLLNICVKPHSQLRECALDSIWSALAMRCDAQQRELVREYLSKRD